MAATDKPYRNQKTLDIVFAVSCILMLVSVVWMLVADYNREYKGVQRTFRDVESVLDERQMVAQLPNPDEVKKAQDAVAEKREALDAARKKVAARDQELTAVRDTAIAEFQTIKADFDSRSSIYNIAVEERDQAGISREVYRERKDRVVALKQELDRLQKTLDDAQTAVDKANADYKHDVTAPVEEAENALSDAEDARKKLTGNFDRFAKLTVQKEWGLGDAFRALPILDAFESPTKIKQIVLNDLPIEYGSFKYVTRYDRCTSCHLAVDRTGFDRRSLTKLTRGVDDSRTVYLQAVKGACNDMMASLGSALPEDDRKKLTQAQAAAEGKEANEAETFKLIAETLRDLRDPEANSPEIVAVAKDPALDADLVRVKELGEDYKEAKSLPEKLKTARQILQARKDKKEDLGFEPGDLPSSWQPVSLTPGQITQFASHPRLDLFVDSNSPHPMEKFGCTICHAGQGSATDFLLSVHTPSDAREHQQWNDLYHWHASHDWEFPMLSNRFVESSCLKCHHEVTDLVRQGSKEEAPKLLRGFNLVRENGCFGCHEIAGIKSAREVGPDLRLEPQPALEWLTPTDQDKAKADPTNPPGAYRKVGPSLRRIAEKTDEAWVRRWIQSPRGFRPDTKMPHFYNLSNDDLAALDATATKDKDGKITDPGQMDFPAAEIHSVAHYILTESAKHFTENKDHKVEATDTARVALEAGVEDLQGQLKKGPLDDKQRKELAELTRRLADLGLLSNPRNAAEINRRAGDLRQTQDRVLELRGMEAVLTKKGGDATMPTGEARELEDATKDNGGLDKGYQAVKEAGQPIPLSQQLIDAEGEPFAPDSLPPQGDAGHLAAGHKVFTERGCLACHVHDGVRQKTADGVQAVPDEAAAFAPDLSRVAEKIKGDDKARRRWLVQWVMNPNIHHPRTRMPVTHLTKEQACDVADWLLSQPVKADDLAEWPADPKEPEAQTLVALARVYLAKAPGMTSANLEKILPADADLDKTPGYKEEELKYAARDADEHILVGPITTDKLERYIGKKSIGRLGCYGCHDVPGFETAKPIGTALNDWGKKDPERMAFEDADAYVRDHNNIVEARDARGNRSQADPDWHAQDGKEPYEKIFFDALEHHTREGFLHQKLMEPRSYDYHRLRAWDDRLRMPQFRFARSRRHAGETDEAYAVRQEREEAEAREAVMTFILGLVAEPIPLKYVNAPTPDRLAEDRGRKVLDKFNCVGCHQVRPGVYEFKPTPETFDALEKGYQDYAAAGMKDDHVFPGHNAWTGVLSPWPDRLVAHGTQAALVKNENAGREMFGLRLTEALRFTNNDRVVRDIPAGMTIAAPPEDVIGESQPYGGAFTELLIPYLAKTDATFFQNKPNSARAVLPPPLVREGERVQPKWLYQFLLNPGTVRPPEKMRLRMPRFNMSSEEAMALVNYFGAADKLSNPGAGLTYPYLKIDQQEDKYWRDMTEEYQTRLKQPGADKPEERAAAVARSLTKPLQDKLAAAEKEAKDLKDDALTTKQKEIDDLKAKLQKIQDWAAALPKDADSPDAYAADAYRLVLLNPNLCSKCHSIGSMKMANAEGPDLTIANERLRPEWMLEWIGNPNRMYAYSPTMPQPFPKVPLPVPAGEVEYKEYLAGDPFDRVRAARDVLMALPRLENLPADRATREAITGGK